ncbi:MAG: N-acetyl sugar amidotransferase [Candidatus Omnitrophica bacterium]|nr:N-acetyl sugar amidotransferase [Candidatus Omnitrophota bacterium]
MSNYQLCRRCIIDTSVPGARFDQTGECSYCKIHDKLEQRYPLDEGGRRQLDKIIAAIKRQGRGKKYDCVLGVSGGRDSIYTLYLTKEKMGLRPLAVHFNDGFGNPVAGENMKKITAKLGVELRTITSDWRESKDLKIAFLKASVPDIEEGTDVGIETALYSVAAKENLKYIISGYSFRTEGICPLEWNYLDGDYLINVHKRFGTTSLRPWKPDDAGFNLRIPHVLYYTVIKGITAVPILNYVNYIRKEAEDIIKNELGWVYPGSKYYDDLYQSLMTYIYRTKFKIERRRYFYSALIRSGQMSREEGLNEVSAIDIIEDPLVISLCLKRLGISREEFDSFMALPLKTFRDYPTSYNIIKRMRWPIWILSQLNILPGVTYDKYFKCV